MANSEKKEKKKAGGGWRLEVGGWEELSSQAGRLGQILVSLCSCLHVSLSLSLFSQKEKDMEMEEQVGMSRQWRVAGGQAGRQGRENRKHQ